ncbi:MAG: ABC transporter permease [Cytophagales bacterium]
MNKYNLINSWRFLIKNKGYAFINVFGLTIGLTGFLLILLFVNHELSFDSFHSNKSDVYRINFSYKDNSGNITTLVNSPPALATGVSGKFPELSKISRMRYTGNCLLSNNEIQYYEDQGYFADSLFLDILKFDLKAGNANTALDQPNSIVISENLAIKYFNDPEPIGKTLKLNNSTALKITGVLSPIPTNSHLDFDFHISFSTYTIPDGYRSDLTSWSWLGFLTYVELKPGAEPKQFEEKLAEHFRELDPDNPNPMQPIVQNLSDIYLKSNGMVDDLASHIRSGNKFSVNALMVVVILILLIAGFNFSNLTNAISISRIKSTGIQKVLGAKKRNIFGHLITESIFLTFFCLLIAIGLVFLIFPTVSTVMGWEFQLGFELIGQTTPIVILVCVIISIVSGIYPALTLAQFDIIQSLKGSFKVESRNQFQLKNVLVVIQLAISIGLIASTIIITKQIDYLQNKNTGYQSENVILIKMLPETLSQHFTLFKDQMRKNASVLGLSRSDRVVGEAWPWSIIQRTDQGPDMSKRVFFNQADYDFFKTMGIKLLAGRSFSKEYTNDPTRSIIINRQAAEYLGLDDPIGKQVHFFEMDGPRTIIGVVEDFNYESLHQKINPAVLVLPFTDQEFMYVRFAKGDVNKQIELMESTWARVTENSPMEWRFLDDKLDQLYRTEEKLSGMVQVFSVLAISLACMGLYGIVLFMVNNRKKEVGIRKVLGANIKSLYFLFVRSYFYKIVLAMVLTIPVIHYLLMNWLQEFAYQIKISWVVYPLSAILLIVLILVTITYQILKVAKVNPIALLRTE